MGTFIKAFKENVILKNDGCYYLHGNFNLGVVISGRLSSSGPNLQNMPSGSTYGKLIKACFKAPKGWLMVSADFAALEAMIGALLTRDPNKLKAYIQGYDGHCINAFAYWPEKMPDIIETVDSINSIDSKYPVIRRESKTVTFAAQYGGTWVTFMNNCGFSKAEAIKIEENYKKLYKVSIEWVTKKLNEAATTGYVTCAFGLRLRTPILSKTIANKRSTPYEAQAEARSAGNAMQQSYGMLNNRSAIEFQERTLASEFATSILPIAHIHDAQYFMVRDDAKCVKWLNDNLIECMQWQKLPEIQHDIVKIGAELIIHYPNWANEVKIPNNVTQEELIRICKEAA